MALKKLPYNSLEKLINENLDKNEDSKTKQIIKELKDARKRGYLQKKELEKICRWKSPRAIHHIKKNTEKKIIEMTAAALKTRRESAKMELLTSLHGVSIPMASAILMLLNPKRYGVIDIRVWELLYSFGTMTTNPKGSNFKTNEWCNYLDIIRYFAKKLNVSARDIDRTLFNVHKEYQDGNLYDNSKINNKSN